MTNSILYAFCKLRGEQEGIKRGYRGFSPQTIGKSQSFVPWRFSYVFLGTYVVKGGEPTDRKGYFRECEAYSTRLKVLVMPCLYAEIIRFAYKFSTVAQTTC